MRSTALIFAATLTVAGCKTATPAATTPAAAAPFAIEETTISQIHAAMRAKTLTCRALVEAYLARIEAFDKKGPALNAITLVNPEALKLADARDAQFAQKGLSGPLHCIPAVVKDNFETIGMMSADGSLALKGFVSDKDAFLVKRIKDAGAAGQAHRRADARQRGVR